jgi:hypothetical protein
MAFESKALRVQLPCGDATVLEGEGENQEILVCAHTFHCGGDYTLILLCGDSCNNPESNNRIEPATMTVGADDLSALRAALERRLSEIDDAERALAER